MQQIADWLEKLGMSEYAERFAENDIDLSVLPDLTDQDLKNLGVARTSAQDAARDRQLRHVGSPASSPSLHLLRLTSQAPPRAATVPVAEAAGERRHVTVMFCDLVDSTGIRRGSMPRNGAISSAPISMPLRRQ